MRTDFSAVMRSHSLVLRPLLALALSISALLAAPASARAEKIRNHFDSDTMMRPPGFFDLVVLGAQGEAKWLVLVDPNPPSAPNKLAQVNTRRPEGSIAAALRRNVSFQDGTVSTFVKKGAGREGLILRMKDEKNFLVLLVDASGDACCPRTPAGSRRSGRGRKTLERPWEQYSVKAEGPQLRSPSTTRSSSRPAISSGRRPHGLAAEGPGEASFDEFVIDPAAQ
jgi:hypothetical protein